jgi:hypothetical protein
LHDAAGDFSGHDFRALGAGVHVAVMAGLIAELADIDLQSGGFRAQQLRQAILPQDLREALGISIAAGKDRERLLRNSHQQHQQFRSLGEQQTAGASVVRE